MTRYLISFDDGAQSVHMAQATGLCRVAVLLTCLGQPDLGRAYVQEVVASLGDRSDPAAYEMRQMADRLYRWLDQLPR